MASSRSMRRSRFPTPLSAPPLDAVSVGSEVPLTKDDAASLTEWQEPPIRPPAPSFEDYKGLERQGVLEYFQPLGTLPTQRVRLRTKAFDTSKRPAPAKNGECTAAASEDMTTPDPAPPPLSRRSESRKTEERTLRLSASRVKDEDGEYTPNGLSMVTPPKLLPSYSHHGTPSSQSTTTRTARLKDVVANAIERANARNDFVLGHALHRLYEQSKHDSSLLDIIDGILSENPNDQQRANFQRYLKHLKKDISKETGIPRVKRSSQARGTSTDLKSAPVLNNGRNHIPDSKISGEDLGLKDEDNSNPTSHPYSPTKSIRHSNNNNNNKSLTKNMSPVNQQPAPDRARRSNSTSSLSSITSSLSSADPNLALQAEEEFGGNQAPPPPPLAMVHGEKAKASAGPKMGIFTTSTAAKRSFAAADPSQEDEELASKRRKLQKTFPDYHVKDSDVRTTMQKADGKRSQNPLPPKPNQPPVDVPRFSYGMGRRSVGEEADELDSPTTSIHSELLIPPPPFAGNSRRGVTPTNLGRPPKTAKKSARVKMSPLKKKNGVVAGMPRSSGVRNSPIGSSHADGEGLNSDECSACGGPGELLCCDGCTRSYHFTCIDPPKDSLPDGEWYCQACASGPLPLSAPARGIFPILQHSLQKRTPIAYNLPRSLRNYYEGVVTGEDGEYEEPGAPPSKAKSRTGYDVPADTLKLKDGKDNIILCYKCNESAMGRREMVNCDFCSLYWHLDCVDPPLASAPKKYGKSTWKCPNHVNSEIAVPRSASGKIYKVRRPKDARVIVPALKRGIKNNGMIEIEDEISEEEDQPPGTIFLVPARMVKLDFISKFKQQKLDPVRMGQQESGAIKAGQRQQQHDATDGRAQRKARSAAGSPKQDDLFHGRTLAERDVALSLAEFAQADSDSALSGDRMEELISTLSAEAPVDLMPEANHCDLASGGGNGDYSGSKVNGNTVATDGYPSRIKAAACNKAAHAANQANAIVVPPLSECETKLLEEELAQILKLEAVVRRKKADVQKRIAAVRTTTATASV